MSEEKRKKIFSLNSPFICNALVTQEFGNNFTINGVNFYPTLGLKGHNGIDLVNSDYLLGHRDVFCPWPGIVYFAGYKDGWGNCIKIIHPDLGIMTIFAHLEKISNNLKQGDIIPAFLKIGVMGDTGNCFGVHLHLGTYKIKILNIKKLGFVILNVDNGYGGATDPSEYLNKKVMDFNLDEVKK